MNKGKIAEEFFSHTNTNCAQAVLSAFSNDAGISQETAMKVASGFGGGIKEKEACGAVTGAIMALGLIAGQKSDDDVESKQKSSDMTIEFNKRFKEKHGSIVCRDLIDDDKCAQLVYDCADILEGLLKV